MSPTKPEPSSQTPSDPKKPRKPRAKKRAVESPEARVAAAQVPPEERPYPIPENWVWVKTQFAITLHRGVSYKKSDAHSEKMKDDCLIMRGGNIKEGRLALDEENVYVSKDLVTQEQFIRKNDVIIVSSTGSVKVIGRAGIAFSDYSDVAFGAFLTLARPSQGLVKKFVAFYFQSDIYRQRIRELASGVNINNIRMEYITDSPFPLPPLAEQERIVARIESLFAKLDEAKEKVQEVADGFEARKSSILHQAFTGELTAQWRQARNRSLDDWRTEKFGNLGKLERGRSQHRPRNDPRLFGGKYPFIQTGDVAQSGMFIERHQQMLSEFGFAQSRMFPAGTLCITIAANIGNAAILSYDCCFPDSVVGFTPFKEKVSSKFCYYMISTLQKELEANAPATAQKNINLKVLNDVVIIVPKLDEQEEILRVVDSLLERERQAREAAEAVLDEIESIKKSILARAFRGELGAGSATDESAEALLRRLAQSAADSVDRF